MMTTESIDRKSIENYVSGLVGRFFKIIPLKEDGNPSVCKYIQSLQRELIGAEALIEAFRHDDRFVQLLVTLQYLSDHNDEADVDVVKAEVFRAINNIKKMQKKYLKDEV